MLVINIGAHCQRTQTFNAWRTYVNQIASVLGEVVGATGIRAVWRTTLPIEVRPPGSCMRLRTWGSDGWASCSDLLAACEPPIWQHFL